MRTNLVASAAHGNVALDAEFVGLCFARMTLAEAAEEVLSRGRDHGFSYIVTPNVDHVVRLTSAPDGSELAAAYQAAAFRLCDSRVLARIARLAGIKLTVVPGSDLTARLLVELTGSSRRVAMIGSDATAIDELRKRYPGIDFVHHDPPMGLASNPAAMAAAAAFAAKAKADVTLLAVGSPQQELIAHAILARGDAVGTGLCIGTSINYLTGRERRAPQLVQVMGFEWMFRLLAQPRRMWRRYLVEGPRILGLALRWRYDRARSDL